MCVCAEQERPSEVPNAASGSKHVAAEQRAPPLRLQLRALFRRSWKQARAWCCACPVAAPAFAQLAADTNKSDKVCKWVLP